jgi:hypothetical protein
MLCVSKGGVEAEVFDRKLLEKKHRRKDTEININKSMKN